MGKKFFNQLKPFLIVFIIIIILAFCTREIISKYHPEWVGTETEVQEVTDEDIIKILDIVIRIWNVNRQNQEGQEEPMTEEDIVYDQ